MSSVKIWNGSSWVQPSGFNRPKVWNGSSWVVAKVKAWNGSNWNNTYSVPQSRTVTVGNFTLAGNKYFPGADTWGYQVGSATGNISPQDLYLWESTLVSEVSYDTINDIVTFSAFSSEAVITNDSWTTLTINGTGFSRTSASYSTSVSGGYFTASWQWTPIYSNPFPTTVGATVTATWS